MTGLQKLSKALVLPLESSKVSDHLGNKFTDLAEVQSQECPLCPMANKVTKLSNKQLTELYRTNTTNVPC